LGRIHVFARADTGVGPYATTPRFVRESLRVFVAAFIHFRREKIRVWPPWRHPLIPRFFSACWRS